MKKIIKNIANSLILLNFLAVSTGFSYTKSSCCCSPDSCVCCTDEISGSDLAIENVDPCGETSSGLIKLEQDLINKIDLSYNISFELIDFSTLNFQPFLSTKNESFLKEIPFFEPTLLKLIKLHRLKIPS